MIFCMKINMKVFYNLVTSLQYLKKEERNKVDFSNAD